MTPAGAVPVISDASCTEAAPGAGPSSPQTAWRVQYSAETGTFGRILRIAGLFKTVPGGSGEVTAASDTWQLRRDWLPSENQDQDGNGSLDPFWTKTGGLATLDDEAMVDAVSPRLVTPDGACTVYLSPFPNLLGAPGAPRVAVLGDTSTMLVSRSTGSTVQGTVQANLNAVGIRTEVEGTDWKSLGLDLAQTTPLAKADSYLVDEYRGLLRHDVDGVVAGLGANDAFRIALAPPATREAKRFEVLAQFMLALSEMLQRSGCLVMVTSPEQTSYPDLNTEVVALNDALRSFAAQNADDSVELVDFAARADGHNTTDPEPAQNAWFEADDLTLNARGRTEYAADLTRAAQLCADTVVVHGAAGSFGNGSLVGLDRIPSGQRVRAQGVPGWSYSGGRRAWWSTVAGDGTILTGNMSHTTNSLFTTGDDMVVSAFHPERQTYGNVRLPTDRGVTHNSFVPINEPEGGASRPLGFDLADLAPIDEGSAVVFAGASVPVWGQDIDGQGQYPIFGVLTRDGTGAWHVAKGADGPDPGTLPDWENQWSPRQLHAATAAASGTAIADEACPATDLPVAETVEDDPPEADNNWSVQAVHDCLVPTSVAVLPGSGDIVIGTYGGTHEPGTTTPYAAGHITVVRVEGPDGAGRYTARVVANEQLPELVDPGNPAVAGEPRVVSVHADPTSERGDERFLVTLDVYGSPAPAAFGDHSGGGPVELSYDADAVDPDDRIVPSSAPFTTPELHGSGPQRHYTVSTPVYDRHGNLWAGVFGQNYTGRGIAIWTKPPGGERAISTSECGFDPTKDLEDYVTGGTGVRPIWAQECKPDYLITQPRSLQTLMSLSEDPLTGDVLAFVMFNGRSFVIDPDGQGENMTFEVSNVVDGPWQGIVQEQIGGWVECPVPPPEPPDPPCQPCPAGSPAAVRGLTQCRWEPTPRPTRVLAVDTRGLFDRTGRAWLTVAQATPRLPKMYTTMDQLEQYMISIDTSRLAGRGAQPLTARDGASTIVQAESTETIATRRTTGTFAERLVDSIAPVAPAPGGGLMLTDASVPGGGVPAETVATYELVVPTPGSYRVCYQARKASTSANPSIRLAVTGGATHDTAITDTGALALMPGPTLSFPQHGTYTVTVSAPDGAHGWQLDWLELRRNPAGSNCT